MTGLKLPIIQSDKNESIQRKIIHIDMDAFYASIEQRDFPQYKNKPVIVGGHPDERGVVATCSYEARKFGIRSAMATRTAYRLCPHAVFLRPRFDAYKEASGKIRAIFSNYTSIIEPLSWDEAYLDVTQSPLHQGSATWIAKSIKRDIVHQLNLTASAGVSYNKFLAKIASDFQKPDGLTVITPQQGARFVQQLAIRQFYGVGAVTEKKMHRLGIYNGADLKKWSLESISDHFGSMSNYLYNAARGIDYRPVHYSTKIKSISRETTFVKDLLLLDEIRQSLLDLANDLWQKQSDRARTLTLKVKYSNFKLITRQTSRIDGFTSTDDVLRSMNELMQKTEIGNRPIRLIGLGLSNFIEETTQADTSAMLSNSLLD